MAMDSSTPYWKNAERSLAFLLCLLLAGCGVWDEPANSLSVERLELRRDYIEPIWQVRLSDSVLEALDSGVAVELVEQIVFLGPHNEVLAEHSRRFRLSHRLLTGNYQIEASDQPTPRGFPGRSALLRGLTLPGEWRLVPPDETSHVRSRLQLDRASLPGSLRLQASWDRQWHSHSPWYWQALPVQEAS